MLFFIKTISASVAEKFLTHCGGAISYTYDGVDYQLLVKLVEDDFVTVTVVNVPYECTGEQIRQYFSQYGEIARVVSLKHAPHLLFPIDSGRRLVVYKRLPKNIPQHVEIGGHKLRVSYTAQIKSCATCGGNHLKYACDKNSADGSGPQATSSSYLQDSSSTTSLQVTIPSRKRLLSSEAELVDGASVASLPSASQEKADLLSHDHLDTDMHVDPQVTLTTDNVTPVPPDTSLP